MSLGGWIILVVLGAGAAWRLYQRHVAANAASGEETIRSDFLDQQRWRK